MANIQDVLGNLVGERVNFLLTNGRDVTGKVKEAGENLVAIEMLDGRVVYLPFASTIYFVKVDAGGIH